MITYLHILPIDLDNDIGSISLDEIFSGYINDKEYWFEQRDVSENLLEGEFFYTSLTSIWIFDDQSQRPIKSKTEILNSVKFVIDIKLKLLEYYGNKRDFGKFTKKLIEEIKFVNSIDTPHLSLKSLHKNLRDSGINLIETTINDYEINDQMIGRYKAKIYSDANIENIFKEFDSRIIQIKFQLNDFQESQSITANKNGYYRVSSLEDDLFEVIQKLKIAQIKSYA